MFYYSKPIFLSLSLFFGLVLLVWSGGCESKREPPLSAPPTIEVTHPLQQEVTDYADYVGRTAAIDSVEVRAHVGGYLQKVNFKEGELVKKGQVLFEIEPDIFQAQVDRDQAALQAAQALLEKNKADLGIKQEMAAGNAASKLDVIVAEGNVNTAAAQVAFANAALKQANIDLGYTQVTSPIDGRVSRYFVTVGNLIARDQTMLTTIVSTGPIYAYFDMDDTTVLRLRRLIREGKAKPMRAGGAPALQLGLVGEDGFPHAGCINFQDNQIAPKTGTLRVRGLFANDDDALQPGYFVRIRVPIGNAHPALLVPDRAVDNDQGRKVLRIVDAKNQVATLPVRFGALHEGLRVIEEGLRHDDRVIVRGLLQVRPGMTVEPKLVEVPRATAAASAGAPAVRGGAGDSQAVARTTEE